MQISPVSSPTPAPIPAAADPVGTAAEPAAPPAAEPIDPVAPVAPAPPSKLLQKLASGHFNPVADLRHRMHLAQEIRDSGLELPEPPATVGHGKAYARFLAAYRAMTGTAPAQPAEPAAPAQPASIPLAPSEPTGQPTVFACLDREG